MIIDITGIELTPGNKGRDCKGNGKTADKNGILIECCCDECNHVMCCAGKNWRRHCIKCNWTECPRYIDR